MPEVSLDDVSVNITVELARKQLTISQVRRIAEEDFIEFDKLAGESFDVLVNGHPFAEGEIAVVTDLMAVRLTRMKDPEVPL